MKRLLILFCFATSLQALASQSTITVAEGESCMGDDKNRRQTEQAALELAKRMAVEQTSTHIASTTVVEDFELKNDIVEAFAEAEVKLLEILEREWRASGPVDRCILLSIKAEVIPAAAPLQRVDPKRSSADPRLPLTVDLWVNSEDAQYAEGDHMTIYLRGNKPFYGRLVYIDAMGNNLQLLPNQHRRENYFQGGTLFEVPTGEDRFDLTVSEPFGEERLILYASTRQLGDIDLTPAGADVYLVNDAIQQVATKTRGIAITARETRTSSGDSASPPRVAEFAEAEVSVRTAPRR